MGALVSKIGFSCRKKKLLGRDPKRTIVKLVRVTNFNESEVKKWMKEFEKDCPDGFLREDEFVAHYSSYFAAGNQRRKEALAKQIFRTFDKDASGCVDFWEFMCGMSALLRGTTVEKLKWAFSMYDLDGNGYICTTELLNVLKLMHELRYPSATEEELEKVQAPLEKVRDRVFGELDRDGDGRLELREFVEGVRKNPALLRMVEEGGDAECTVERFHQNRKRFC